jgi:hypothetical protein
MTWRDLIQMTLEDLGVYGQASPASANDESAALNRLNDWIDWLKTQKLSMYQIQRTTWAITGASSYTLGVGGNISVSRPPGIEFIAGVGYVDQSVSPEFEVNLGDVLTLDDYRAIAFKSLTATYPNGFYYEGSYPFATLRPWPIPTGSNLLGVIYSGVAINEIVLAQVGAAISLPPGYRRFMRLGLKIECAPAFKKEVDPQWVKDYEKAFADIQRVNEQMSEISFGVAGGLFGGSGSQSDIYSGEA